MVGNIFEELDPDKIYYEHYRNRIRKLRFIGKHKSIPGYVYVLDTMLDEPTRLWLPRTYLFEHYEMALVALLEYHKDSIAFWDDVLTKDINERLKQTT